MPEATNTNTQQTSSGEGSLVVGKLRPAAGMWVAFEGIFQTDPVRNGVLIIFAANMRGRLGIFCNRYVSGAVNETTGSTGLDAVRELITAETGMFGYRPCMGTESQELAQSLVIDLDELLLLRGEKNDISEALLVVTAAGAGERVRDTKTLEPAFDGATNRSGNHPSLRVEKSTPDQNFSYIDWFAVDEAAQTDDLPKFRQILMNALPPSISDTKDGGKNGGAESHDDVAMYGRLLEAEQQKVIRDIELSMSRARTANGGGNEEAISELQMMSEFIQAEQARAQKWQGLDEIPTPKAVPNRGGSGPINKGNLPRAATDYKDMHDLLSVSQHRLTLPKDFIKRIATEEAPPKQIFDVEWLRRPWVIASACITVTALIVTGIVTMQSRSEFEEALSHAKTSLKMRHPEDAVYVLNKALEKDGGNYRAYFYRGLAYSEMGEYEKASKDFETSMNLGGPRERTLLARASAACRATNYDEAIEATSDILKLNPKNVEAAMIRATCYERMKDYGHVIKDTTKALEVAKNPDERAHLLLQRGVAYTKEGKPAEAGKDFGDAIRLKPDAATYMQRGDAYRLLKNYTSASNDYSKVITFDSRNYEAYVSRGMCAAAMHRDKDALKDFARALAINKTGVEAMIQRGSLMLANGHYRLAANDFEDAMRLCPHDVETQQKLAMTYTHLHKEFPKAWLHNNEVVAVDAVRQPAKYQNASATTTDANGIKMPTDPQSLINLGYKYLANGEVSYATQMFAEAIKKDPNNVEARRYLAHALLQSGSTQAAVSQFDALVQLDGAMSPKDVLAYARALVTTGDTNRAADVLNQSVSTRPRDIALRGELIRMYNTLGMAQRAQASYRDGLRFARSQEQRSELDAALHGTSSGGGSAKPLDAKDLGG